MVANNTDNAKHSCGFHRRLCTKRAFQRLGAQTIKLLLDQLKSPRSRPVYVPRAPSGGAAAHEATRRRRQFRAPGFYPRDFAVNHGGRRTYAELAICKKARTQHHITVKSAHQVPQRTESFVKSCRSLRAATVTSASRRMSALDGRGHRRQGAMAGKRARTSIRMPRRTRSTRAATLRRSAHIALKNIEKEGEGVVAPPMRQEGREHPRPRKQDARLRTAGQRETTVRKNVSRPDLAITASALNSLRPRHTRHPPHDR